MKKIIVSPHDKMFRAALSNINVAREFFQKYLSDDILKVVNLDVLVPCPDIHINQNLERSESDVVYKTEIAGKPGYLCFAGEQQSKSEIFMPLRMVQYDCDIWSFHIRQNPKSKKLPLIINVVFYTGKHPYKNPTDFRDLFDVPKELVDAFYAKPFKLIQARDISDQELTENKWCGFFMYLMKHIRSIDLSLHMSMILHFLRTLDALNAVQYIEAGCAYALTAGEISDVTKFIEELRNAVSETVGDKIVTGAEQLIEMGKNEGMQQGMQQGELNGERIVLKRQLSKRFGSIPPNYIEKLDNASPESLLEWIDKVIEAKTIDDVFATRH